MPIFENRIPVIKETKTGVSRHVSMPSWYMDEMRLFQEEWIKDKEATGDLWAGGNREFVFHSGFGRPYYPQKATNEWIKFREKYGFEGLRLHDMRHTMVALLIEEGVNLKTI
ncbi:tyrosine-type recombinase/integrase [Cytobacillus massiliigabonensis]|uniref:tyrosine-type recombinase/integrase n=1 Tax=Cytobacillus massiliigabonensis TaxID=1871011 RepID=UPI000C850091|nr:tyrosine-type recombinase/integrase [Cytobacillus massiliigabonensis]